MPFITPSFLDLLRDKIAVSDIVGRRVRLIKKGDEFLGLCPFHHEKTPSFTINDSKGFYHCFGCGAHGDIVRYLMEAEKMPFREAVEYLAHRAGIPMPKSSAEEVHLQERRNDLTTIMEEACHFFHMNLFGDIGASARAYLIKRGITSTVARQFRLGYAPPGSALTAHLEAKGFNLKQCQALGLIAEGRDGRGFHDYFYDRVMFPILDRRKKVIAFGGRMMAKGEPKYLNSPETELFHKGDTLYALPHALETMRKTNNAILVEGYMDVIALHSAGFTNAVAPLGTALTEAQIKILWQSTDEPIICFDGDAAGQKASYRALHRALPHLTPGKSLRFVFLPSPFDPDDMIRKKSPEAFRQALAESQSFITTLWQYLLSEHQIDTPERLAKLEEDALHLVNSIQNTITRSYYTKEIKDRLWHLTHQASKRRKTTTKVLPVHSPTPGLLDAKIILAYFVSYPEVASSFLEDIDKMFIPERELADLRQKISSLLLEKPEITSSELKILLEDKDILLLKNELAILEKSSRTLRDVQHELAELLEATRVQTIQAEISSLTQEYLTTGNSEIWERILTLKKEIEKRSESE